jgi:peptidoglycan/xylan/chitin deacetylase (PgdA/CDA1 family)
VDIQVRRRVRQALRRAGARKRVATARVCCERNLMARWPRHSGSSDRPRILCYHAVGTPSWGVNDLQADRFRRQLEHALDSGRRFVPALQIASGCGSPGDLAVTFDDGLASVASNAAPVLKDLGIPWTMFVVTDWADGRSPWSDDGLFLGWRDIECLAARGANIASHSVTHPYFRYLSRETAAIELARSRETLRQRTGIDTAEFAIPMGQSSDWTIEFQAVARSAGYRYVYAQSEELRTPGTIARTFVTRFDNDRVFEAAINGRFDHWEEWT